MGIKQGILTTALVLFTGLLSSCGSVQVSLPAISQENTGHHDSGRVIWHDLLVRDIRTAEKFYGELFGWQFKQLDLYGNGKQGNYSLIMHKGRPIAGMVDTTQLRKDVNLVQWVSVFSTADIDKAVSSVKTAGGTVYTAPSSIGERGELAVVADSQGGLFAMLQTKTGDPAETSPEVGGFLWDELWTRDTEKAKTFYQALFPYDSKTADLENGDTYHYFATNQTPRAAVITNPVDGLAPTWVTFIRVDDPASIVAKAEQLGGKVLLDVQDNPVGGKLAIIQDPDGAGFVVQTWNNNREGQL